MGPDALSSGRDHDRRSVQPEAREAVKGVEVRRESTAEGLRWDKTSCHRFTAYLVRLLMGALASNLFHMVRRFYLSGEEVKRSMECLSSDSLGLEREFPITQGGGLFMLPPRSLMLITIAPHLGEARLFYIDLDEGRRMRYASRTHRRADNMATMWEGGRGTIIQKRW